ncbi:N-acetyltransferase family protein [Marinomonas sp. 2405UD68-3]|uniref:GNAT family N-acetyltransferase n=1 Tax=Marinomonas sp. 2405UD68-3 TaxID=3391835 RepID=UPI0039C9E658
MSEINHLIIQTEKGADDAPFFRIAEMEDAPAILEIYNEAVRTRCSCGHTSPITLISVIDWLEASYNKRPMWVIEVSRKIIGWFSIQDFYGLPAFSSAVEVGIYISPSAQNQGLASKSLIFLEAFVRRIDVSHIVACIYRHNLNSICLFEKNNYEQWGCLPNIASIDGNRHDLLLLGKQLF